MSQFPDHAMLSGDGLLVTRMEPYMPGRNTERASNPVDSRRKHLALEIIQRLTTIERLIVKQNWDQAHDFKVAWVYNGQLGVKSNTPDKSLYSYYGRQEATELPKELSGFGSSMHTMIHQVDGEREIASRVVRLKDAIKNDSYGRSVIEYLVAYGLDRMFPLSWKHLQLHSSGRSSDTNNTQLIYQEPDTQSTLGHRSDRVPTVQEHFANMTAQNRVVSIALQMNSMLRSQDHRRIPHLLGLFHHCLGRAGLHYAAYRGFIEDNFAIFKTVIQSQGKNPVLEDDHRRTILLLTTEVIKDAVYQRKGWSEETKSEALLAFMKRILD